MVLEGLRKKFLRRGLKRSRGRKREAFQKELSGIEAKESFEKQVKQTRQQAFQREQLAQASRIGKESARVQAEAKIKAVQRSGGKSGFLAGFDKFLAGTGVAKGTSQVLGAGSGAAGLFGSKPKKGGRFNPVTGRRE